MCSAVQFLSIATICVVIADVALCQEPEGTNATTASDTTGTGGLDNGQIIGLVVGILGPCAVIIAAVIGKAACGCKKKKPDATGEEPPPSQPTRKESDVHVGKTKPPPSQPTRKESDVHVGKTKPPPSQPTRKESDVHVGKTKPPPSQPTRKESDVHVGKTKPPPSQPTRKEFDVHVVHPIKEDRGAVAIYRENQHNINCKFGVLLMNSCKKLREKKDLNMPGFCLFLKGLFPPGDCIPVSSNVDEIFAAITWNKLWDYWNWTPLRKVVQEFVRDDQEMKSWIETYKKDLTSYKTTTELVHYIALVDFDRRSDDLTSVKEQQQAPARYDRRYYRKLSIKRELTNHTLKYLDELWEDFADLYNLQPLRILLDYVCKGSILIVWLIPAHLAHNILRAAPGSGDIFRKHQITRVEFDGVCIYPEAKQHSEGSVDEPRPKPAVPAKSCPMAPRKCDTDTLPKKKKCNIDPNCHRLVCLIVKLSSILSRDPESDVLGRMKLALEESTVIDPEVFNDTKTVQEFFKVLSKYWICYADHDLLNMVIDATQNMEAIDALRQSKDPGIVIPLVEGPDAPFQPTCSGSEIGRRVGTSAEIVKEENGVGGSLQEIAGRNAIVLEANRRKNKRAYELPEPSEDDLLPEQKTMFGALLHMEGKNAVILEANQKKISQKKACELPKLSHDELPPEQNTTQQKTAISQHGGTDTTNSSAPANTSQLNNKGDEFLESLFSEESTTRQRSSLVISQQPSWMARELELSEDLKNFHYHPDSSHELLPGRVPVVAKVGLDYMNCGMYDLLKDVVASVFQTPREALSLLGVFKGPCILVWHVSEPIAARIKRILLSPDDQELLLQCAVMKLSCGEDCLFNISEEELEGMVASGMIPEFAETVSEEGDSEDMGRVRAVTSDEEFECVLKQAGDSLVVVDFTANWCYWSVLMNPIFAKLSEQYTEAEFLSVNTEECKVTAAEYDVNAVPMFAFIRMEKLLDKFSGARTEKLLEANLKHFLEGSGALFPGKGCSLLPKEDPDTEGAVPTAEREGMKKRGEAEREGTRGKGEAERERTREKGETEREGTREKEVIETESIRKDRHKSGEEGEEKEAGESAEGKKEEGGEDAKVEEKGGGRKSEEQPPPPPPITMDPSLPMTSVQIILADGSRLKGKFNHSHTVGDVHRLITLSKPSLAAKSYILMTTFPMRKLTDDTQTLADANLLNAVIRQLT